MIKEVDIIFFVEHKDRELESIKLIAEKLKESGKTSLILSIYFHVHYLYFYKAKIFVFPYLINQNDWPVSIIYKMYGDSVEYINMNWEQLFSKANEEFKKPQDNFVKEKVKHISWSNYFKSYLLRHGVQKENINITGNPANEILFQLLNKNNHLKDRLSKEFNLDINKKWIFFPMNYGWAFFSDKMILKKIEAGYKKDIAYEYRSYSKKCLEKFVYFIDDISKKYDYEIIIRPHPSITEDDYRNVFNKGLGYIPKNVILNKKYSIREWIIASDIIGSSWSTSVWDAYNVGKSVFLFTPYKRPEWLDVWWNNEVNNITCPCKLNESSLSKKEIKVKSDLGITENISNFILNIEKSIDIPTKRKKVIFDIRSNIKIFKSLLLEKNILNSEKLSYDFIKMHKY
ncbi:MAG: hypothetical protein QM490_01175 [Candidatus Gracilibacteria bacterium]